MNFIYSGEGIAIIWILCTVGLENYEKDILNKHQNIFTSVKVIWNDSVWYHPSEWSTKRIGCGFFTRPDINWPVIDNTIEWKIQTDIWKVYNQCICSFFEEDLDLAKSIMGLGFLEKTPVTPNFG